MGKNDIYFVPCIPKRTSTVYSDERLPSSLNFLTSLVTYLSLVHTRVKGLNHHIALLLSIHFISKASFQPTFLLYTNPISIQTILHINSTRSSMKSPPFLPKFDLKFFLRFLKFLNLKNHTQLCTNFVLVSNF